MRKYPTQYTHIQTHKQKQFKSSRETSIDSQQKPASRRLLRPRQLEDLLLLGYICMQIGLNAGG
jgi:hypothetical protein